MPLLPHRRFFDLGYAMVVPVMPADGVAAPDSTLAIGNRGAGKTPASRAPDGLWWGLKDWLSRTSTLADLDRYAAMGASVGIRTGLQPDGNTLVAIDADATDLAVAALIRACIARRFGALPCRIGRAPKALFPIRVRGAFVYRRIEFGKAKPFDRVELLSDKRQMVVEGLHPKTMRLYEWTTPLPRYEDLPLVDEAEIDAFLAELETLLPDVQRVKKDGDADAAPAQSALRGKLEHVRDAVNALPNSTVLFPDRESYLNVGYALKAALPDDREEGLALYLDWCARWDSGDSGEVNDLDVAEADWRRMSGPFRLGASWLYDQAERHSGGAWSRAQVHFETPPKDALAGLSFDVGRGGPTEELPEPLDLFSLRRPVPPTDLPEACVPPVIERWALDTAQRMGAPLAFTALSALATLSASIGARLRLQPKKFDTGWTTPAFLWVALVENPGGKKSPAIGAATRTLTKLSAEHGTVDQAKWKAWEKASRSRKADANPGPEPRIRRYSTDSFTIESLRRILNDNPGGVLVSSDELTVVFGALDAYKSNKGADRPMFLRLFDGGGVTIDRVNTAHHVANFGASIVGGIQPKVIARMAPDLDADGLLQRFVLVNGDGQPMAGIDRAPDAEAQAAYDRLVTELATAEFRFPEPITIGDEARPVWDEMERKIERLGAFPHLSDAWRGHLNKWPAIFARLLLVFHVAERWTDLGLGIDGSAVTVETARRAARMADFLIAQSIFFYEHYVGLGQGADDLLWFAGHLLVDPKIASFTERDLYQARRELRGSDKREARRDLIQQLELAGWCDKTEPTRNGSPQWRINPRIHMRFAREAEREREDREHLRQRMIEAFAERTRMADRKG